MYDYPSPGGEPLWCVSAALATFVPALLPPENLQEQAAPANDPAAIHSLAAFDSLHPAHRAASRWVIRGSRVLSCVSAIFALRRNSRGDRARAKAAPLQALGGSHVPSTSQTFRGRRRGRERRRLQGLIPTAKSASTRDTSAEFFHPGQLDESGLFGTVFRSA